MKHLFVLLLCGCGAPQVDTHPDPYDIYVTCMNAIDARATCINNTISKRCNDADQREAKRLYTAIEASCLKTSSKEECAAYAVLIATDWCDDIDGS